MKQAAFPGLIARGRDAELATLGSQLELVRSGVGAVVLMEGGAGMGKSRLLEEGARIAGRMSFRVGSGAAEPGEGIVELAPLMEALFGLPGVVAAPIVYAWIKRELLAAGLL